MKFEFSVCYIELSILIIIDDLKYSFIFILFQPNYLCYGKLVFLIFFFYYLLVMSLTTDENRCRRNDRAFRKFPIRLWIFLRILWKTCSMERMRIDLIYCRLLSRHRCLYCIDRVVYLDITSLRVRDVPSLLDRRKRASSY